MRRKSSLCLNGDVRETGRPFSFRATVNAYSQNVIIGEVCLKIGKKNFLAGCNIQVWFALKKQNPLNHVRNNVLAKRSRVHRRKKHAGLIIEMLLIF